MKHTVSIDSIKPKITDSKIFDSSKQLAGVHENSSKDLRVPFLRADTGGKRLNLKGSNADLLAETSIQE